MSNQQSSRSTMYVVTRYARNITYVEYTIYRKVTHCMRVIYMNTLGCAVQDREGQDEVHERCSQRESRRLERSTE